MTKGWTSARSRSWKIPFRGRHAVAGFFEDLPALMIVLIGISIFMVSTLWIFGMLEESYKAPNLVADREDFTHRLRSYAGFQYDKTKENGMFDPIKIKYCTGENLSRDLHPDFEFFIEIYDISPSYEHINRTRTEGGAINSSGEPVLPDMQVVAGYCSINIMMPLGDVHAARMEVMIWYN